MLHETRHHPRTAAAMQKLAGWARRLSTAIGREDMADARVCFDAMKPYGLECRWMTADEAKGHQRKTPEAQPCRE